MRTLPISQVSDFLFHVAYRNHEPTMIVGEPGLGKTVVVEDFAKRIGAHLCGERLGQIESVDARGLPDVANGRTKWCPPENWPFKANAALFPQDRPIVFFLDEINGATSQGMFAIAMQVVNERRVGPHELLDNVIIVAAGNRESDRGVAQKMPTTCSNRLTWVEAGRDLEGWCLYMQDKYGPEKTALPIALYHFRMRHGGDLLYTFDPSRPDKAFSTGRTAEKAWRYYNDPDMPDSVKWAAMSGVIGEGPSTEAKAFVDVWSRITPIERIIAEPTKVKLAEEPSLQYAMTMHVSGHLSVTSIAPLTTYLNRMSPEFGILAWQLAVKRDKQLYTTKEFLAFAKKNRTVFVA